jgi:hypothetical protein
MFYNIGPWLLAKVLKAGMSNPNKRYDRQNGNSHTVKITKFHTILILLPSLGKIFHLIFFIIENDGKVKNRLTFVTFVLI